MSDLDFIGNISNQSLKWEYARDSRWKHIPIYHRHELSLIIAANQYLSSIYKRSCLGFSCAANKVFLTFKPASRFVRFSCLRSHQLRASAEPRCPSRCRTLRAPWSKCHCCRGDPIRSAPSSLLVGLEVCRPGSWLFGIVALSLAFLHPQLHQHLKGLGWCLAV